MDKHADIRLAGCGPYAYHDLMLYRSDVSGRLQIDISSFEPGTARAVRIETGPLALLTKTLQTRYGFSASMMVQTLRYLCHSARLIAEVTSDMAEGLVFASFECEREAA